MALKDIYQQRKMLLFNAVIALAMMAAFTRIPAGTAIFYTYIIMLTFGYVTRSTYDDDRNKSFFFLRSLPIPPGQIVISKYISTLLMAAAAYAFAVGGYLGMVSVGLATPDPFVVTQGLVFLAIALLLMGSFLTAFFVWNYKQAMGSLRVLMMVGMLLFVFPKAEVRFVTYYLSDPAIPFKILGFSVVVYFLLILVSVWTFARKEVAARG